MKLKSGTHLPASSHLLAKQPTGPKQGNNGPNYRPCIQYPQGTFGEHVWVKDLSEAKSLKVTCCTRLNRAILQPVLCFVGQCAFGLALLSITVGISLCVWGFLGSSKLLLRIAGPICIGFGIIIYVTGCFICCGERSKLDQYLARNALENKTRETLSHLASTDVIRFIQSEPKMFEDFTNLSSIILEERR